MKLAAALAQAGLIDGVNQQDQCTMDALSQFETDQLSVIHGLRSSRFANVVRRFLHGPQPTFNMGLLEQL